MDTSDIQPRLQVFGDFFRGWPAKKVCHFFPRVAEFFWGNLGGCSTTDASSKVIFFGDKFPINMMRSRTINIKVIMFSPRSRTWKDPKLYGEVPYKVVNAFASSSSTSSSSSSSYSSSASSSSSSSSSSSISPSARGSSIASSSEL